MISIIGTDLFTESDEMICVRGESESNGMRPYGTVRPHRWDQNFSPVMRSYMST